MSTSRSVAKARRLPAEFSRPLEDAMLAAIRSVLFEAGVKSYRGVGRKVLTDLIPIVTNELKTAVALGKVKGKAEIEGAIPCALCGHRLVWQACGTNAGWRHVEPMRKRHVATPRDAAMG